MWGDGWEDYLEGPERMDLIKTARSQWMNLNFSNIGRLDKLFDHRGTIGKPVNFVRWDQAQTYCKYY
jgi:hypothetical protein